MIIQRVSPTEVTLASGSTTVRISGSTFTVNNYTIETPGEYDVAGIAFDVGVGYGLLHLEQLRVLVIESSHPQLAAESISELEGIDLVVVPAEDDPVKRKAVSGLINDLEPHGVVVLGSADDAKALAGQAVEPVAKLKVQSADLANEELRVWTVAQ